MQKTKAKPTKVELSPEAKAAIARLLPEIQAERNNYQIGVGTLVAEIIEVLAREPMELQRLLLELKSMDEEPKKEVTLPHREKKVASGRK